jgi:WD40 repeat protein
MVAFWPPPAWTAQRGSGDSTIGQELVKVTHGGWVASVVVSPDGMLATASDDKPRAHGIARSGQELLRVIHEKSVSGVAFSPHGSRLATASED